MNRNGFSVMMTREEKIELLIELIGQLQQRERNDVIYVIHSIVEQKE